jgi:RimJ/RimL family protein N-acetyltransferase
VRLEPLTVAHVPALALAGAEPEIWRWMPYGPVISEPAMRAWVEEILSRQARGTDLVFVVIHQSHGLAIGSTRFMDIQPAHDALEIGGTWYGPGYQRTGVNTECKRLLLTHAFETLGAHRVQLKTDLRNERSQRAIERLGAVREGVLREHMRMPDGYRRSSVYYSILASDWPAVRQRLAELTTRGTK